MRWMIVRALRNELAVSVCLYSGLGPGRLASSLLDSELWVNRVTEGQPAILDLAVRITSEAIPRTPYEPTKFDLVTTS